MTSIFSSLKMRILLGIYIFVMISIPIGAYLASEQTTFKSKAQEVKPTQGPIKTTPKPISPAKQISDPPPSPTPESDSDSKSLPTTSFGPTLSLKVSLEGRSTGNFAGRLFVGIAEGKISINPKFLLSFTVDLPASGEYMGLSLAGLNPGTTYSALVKGSSQLAKAVEFVMSPTVTNLNNGEIVSLLSGDLNEDNTVNTSDYSIAQKIVGLTSKSSNWNENTDINKDGIINTLDLAFITKNFGKIGDSGAWTSPLPKTATPSAELNTSTNPPVGSTGNSSGYWIWVPK